MEDVWLVLLGWALGLASSAGMWAFQKGSQARELHAGIVAECDELCIRMAALVTKLSMRTATADRATFLWYGEVVARYSGPLRDAQLDEALRRVHALPDDQLQAVLRSMWRPEVGLGIKPIHAPALVAALPSLPRLGGLFFRRGFDVVRRLEELNHEISLAQGYLDRTFDSGLSEINREIVESNLASSYLMIQKMARWTVDSMTELARMRLSRLAWAGF